MRSIAVYCGSSLGADVAYEAGARQLGRIMAQAGLGVVYGGAKVGTMGAVADGALAADGRVIGVIPRSLQDKELAHAGLTELHVVESMHERKAMMADLADGFIALPGGVGTLEEFFEVWTWAQLGHHAKPCGLLNVNGYYGKMLPFLDHMVSEQFVRPQHRDMILVDDDAASMIARMRAYVAPRLVKWIK